MGRIITPIFSSGGGGADLTSDLEHYWDLDDDGVWADDVGSWDWTENGTVALDATGAPDGGGCVDLASGYLTQSSNRAWTPSTDNLTINIWARANFVQSTGNWIWSWRNTVPTGALVQITIRNDSPDYFSAIVWDDAGDSSNPTGTTTPSTGTWYMLTITDDGTTRRLYVDGTEEDTDTTTLSGTYESASMSLAIAQSGWSTAGSRGHQGDVCMAGIWSRALSPTDITALYNNGSGKRYVAL